MEYLDPIETARAILAGELSENLESDVDLEDTEVDVEVEEDSLEEAYHSKGKMKEMMKKKLAAQKDHDDEDDDDDEDDEVEEDVQVNPKSEEDKDLYQDAEGKGAKVAKPIGNKSGANKGTIKPKKTAAKGKVEAPTATKEEIDHHMTTLFDGEQLSEDFMTKASTIFEAVINEKISEVENSLLEQYNEVIEEHTQEVTKELAEKLDNYLSYVVEKWVEENEIAIETGIRADVAEQFMTGLKELFDNSYVSVPDEKNDLVEHLAEAVVDLQDKLENEIARNIDLSSNVMESRCETILSDVCEGLVDIESDKLRSLAEGIEFDTEDQYREKLDILKESYFNGDTVYSEDDATSSDNPIVENTHMQSYMSAISKTSKVARENKLD
tara:strand:- start:145 stop:1293 length:1149 start_codon:yes stop_codon:yes gene_type:complete